VVGEFPELGKVEIILSECDPDGWAAGTIHDNPNLFYRNTEYYASFVAATVASLLDRTASTGAQIDGMLTWAFLFEDRDYFEGFRTLSTNGVDKPVLNVFRMLANLGGTRLACACDRAHDPVARGRADEAEDLPTITGVAAIDATAGVQVFLASHHDDWDVKTASEVTITLKGAESGQRYRVYHSLVAKGSSNSYTVWDEMGRPQPPNAKQLTAMMQAAKLKTEALGETTSTNDGVAFTVVLPSHSASLVRFVPIQE
jgi:xylan 1,4-beta-xylosidase